MRRRVSTATSALVWTLWFSASGCNLPDVSVRPRYVPTGEQLGSGAGRTVALRVRDSRQDRGKSTQGGAEILAQGDKGKVYLKESYEDIVTDGLRSALEAAGFQVVPEAPIVIDADLRVTELDAGEFTHWKLDSETGSTLDAFRVVLAC